MENLKQQQIQTNLKHTYTGIRFTTTSQYIDIHTGEEITKNTARLDYTIIANDRFTTLNKLKTHATINYIFKCRRKQQLRLF